MASVVWSAAAIDQIIQITAYIRVFNPASATLIGDRLFDLGERLATFPLRGTPRADGTRAMVTVQPYVLTYVATDDEVTIVDVRHGAREPFQQPR